MVFAFSPFVDNRSVWRRVIRADLNSLYQDPNLRTMNGVCRWSPCHLWAYSSRSKVTQLKRFRVMKCW